MPKVLVSEQYERSVEVPITKREMKILKGASCKARDELKQKIIDTALDIESPKHWLGTDVMDEVTGDLYFDW